MKTKRQRLIAAITIIGFTAIAVFLFGGVSRDQGVAYAEPAPTPTPVPVPATPAFDQAAAIAKLKEQIKGHEQDLAPTVFKNIQMFKTMPAGRVLAIMENGYARSLGVDCSHCHIPDKWESEERVQKQITRDMAGMAAKINGELLKGIKNLKSENPVVNCTTCHRGQVKPATNLSPPPKS